MGKILPCTCRSEYQDARYGAGRRYHNAGENKHVCTVCGNEKGMKTIKITPTENKK